MLKAGDTSQNMKTEEEIILSIYFNRGGKV